MVDGYRGVFGAFPYAFRRSDSWLFRSYVVVGGLAAAIVALAFTLSLIRVFGATAGLKGGSLTLSRSFVVVVGLLAVAPLVAPVLLVARAHRREERKSTRYDPLLALGGYCFLLSLYLMAIAAMPESFVLDGETVTRPPPSGLFAPLVGALYSMPPISALILPLVPAAFIVYVHRRFG
jgi:hypothetical protein